MRQFIHDFINNSDNPTYNKIIKFMWIGALSAIGMIALLFFGLSFTDLPSVQQLENPKSEEASLVYASNGEVLGRYYTENRIPVSYEQLSPNLISALIATEDERYYQHSGIDFEALGRVAIKTVAMGDASSGGASTITQQLAKLLFTGTASDNIAERILQKLKEWIIAVRLERKYTKEEILSMYLNKFSFINGAYGIKAASEIYFGKSQDSLEIQEAAVLVGMLKNPSLFNPLRRPDTVLHRRMVVLKQMEKNGLLTSAQYDSLRTLPLGINFTRQTHIDGLAPYFRMEVAKDLKKILDEYKKSDGTSFNIYRDGLRIYTTIDPKIQQIAEEEMVRNMKRVQDAFWKTWRKMDPWTYESRDSENEVPVSMRQESLVQLLRNSDRYQSLRQKHLSPILKQVSEEYSLEFHNDDREIERMVEEAKEKGTIAKLVSQKMISSELASQYRKVINSEYFPKLEAKWKALSDEVKKVFEEPTEMTVFAYNDKMETDTLMSPLDSIRYHRMFLQTGVMAVDPVTGYVKAWIGGISHKYFQYDHVRINRQVGSTFKPFIYATAIAQQGFSPCYPVYDLPVTIRPEDGQFHLLEPWTPRNSDNTYTGELLTLKEGLRKSKNTVSVYLMKQLESAEPVRDLVHQMGIDKYAKYPNGRFRVPDQPSIALGSTDLSVMEMTGAYTTFANNGIHSSPIFILRIEDKNGRTIYEAFPSENKALDPRANYVMVEMLRYAATGLGNLKSQVGGKTGTTNDYVDGWFLGITPGLVVGTWVGGEDRWMRFRSITYGQGAFMAKPFFRDFIQRLEKEPDIDFDPTARFYRPPGDLGIEMDCSQYNRGSLPLEENNEFRDELNDEFGDEGFGVDFQKAKQKKEQEQQDQQQ